MMLARKPLLVLLAAVFILGLAVVTEAKDMMKDVSLDAEQQSIVAIAALTASGDLDRLKPALNDGLDAGLTLNETKEILVQMYAYTGFPRSLNGLGTLMKVVEERQANGIVDEEGPEASPLPEDWDRDTYGARLRAELSGLDEVPPPAEWQKFCPVIDDYLKQHLFADIFARDVLTHQQRELATIAALANMTGTDGQLAFHFGAAMNTGLTEEQMHGFVTVMTSAIGEEQGRNAGAVLADVLASRNK